MNKTSLDSLRRGKDFDDGVIEALEKAGYNSCEELFALTKDELEEILINGSLTNLTYASLNRLKQDKAKLGYMNIVGLDNHEYLINISRITSICELSKNEYSIKLNSDEILVNENEIKKLFSVLFLDQ